jgi:uncharacterized protein (TIGR00106 family)
LTIIPVGTGTTSASPYVARCQEILGRIEGIEFRLTPMATILEGELPVILDAVARLHASPFEAGAKRVVTSLMIDDRRDKELTMEGKLASVREKL